MCILPESVVGGNVTFPPLSQIKFESTIKYWLRFFGWRFHKRAGEDISWHVHLLCEAYAVDFYIYEC